MWQQSLYYRQFVCALIFFTRASSLSACTCTLNNFWNILCMMVVTKKHWIFACFEAFKIYTKIFFFHASEIENLTYIDWWVMRWARRAKQKGCEAMDGKGENEILITMQKVYTFSHSIDWLAFITHDIHCHRMSVEFRKLKVKWKFFQSLHKSNAKAKREKIWDG